MLERIIRMVKATISSTKVMPRCRARLMLPLLHVYHNRGRLSADRFRLRILQAHFRNANAGLPLTDRDESELHQRARAVYAGGPFGAAHLDGCVTGIIPNVERRGI